MSATPTEPKPVTEPFKRDIAAFLRRIDEGAARDRETAEVVKRHLMAMGPRIGQAFKLLNSDNPNLGSVRSYLKIGKRDLEAALKACPPI